MSLALQRVTCLPLYESPAVAADDGPSCSSSIGRNSDFDGGSDGGDESEVQSRLRGPLDTMDALEESLPARRDFSKHGKSKSYASLDYMTPSSPTDDPEKEETPYSRKRKNLFALSFWDKSNRQTQKNRGGIAASKRPTNLSRSTQGFSHGICCSSSGSNSQTNCSVEEVHSENNTCNAQIPPSKPTKRFSFPMRSFSMANLEGVVCSSSSGNSLNK